MNQHIKTILMILHPLQTILKSRPQTTPILSNQLEIQTTDHFNYIKPFENLDHICNTLFQFDDGKIWFESENSVKVLWSSFLRTTQKLDHPEADTCSQSQLNLNKKKTTLIKTKITLTIRPYQCEDHCYEQAHTYIQRSLKDHQSI